MRRTITIIVLLIGLGIAGVFAFFQTRNLQALETQSTAVVSALGGTATEAAISGIASQTALADSAYASYTQAAQNFSAAAATSTEAAHISETNFQNAAATSTQAADEAFATGTSLADSAIATGTSLADAAFASSTEAAAEFATEAALGTASALTISNQEATAAMLNQQQATLQAQNLVLSGTVEASGWAGNGILDDSATLPEGFQRFADETFELALPESFEGADLNDNPRSFFALLDSLRLEGASEYLRNQDENFLFFAIDTTMLNTVPRASVSLLRDIPVVETNLGDYLGGAYVGLQGNSALVITDVLPVNGQAVGRSIVEQTFENSAVRQMQYVFQLESNFYVLTFTTPVSEFTAMQPVFEVIAGTLRIRN